MNSQEEAKEFLSKAWASIWVKNTPDLSEFFHQDVEVSGFSPPKQTTWKGFEAVKAHFDEIYPIIASKSFNITTLDLANGGNTIYAIWDVEFELKAGEGDHVLEGNGIVRVVLKDGKVGVWTMFEDPTPFVSMALKGQMGPIVPEV